MIGQIMYVVIHFIHCIPMMHMPYSGPMLLKLSFTLAWFQGYSTFLNMNNDIISCNVSA